jgi:hypothetical protein
MGYNTTGAEIRAAKVLTRDEARADRGEQGEAAGVVAPNVTYASPMSAFGGKADIGQIPLDVCF